MASDGTRFTFTARRTPADIFVVMNSKLKQSLSFLFSLDITGMKINLNGWGCPGTAIQTLLAAVLGRLSGEDAPEDEDDPDQYKILFNFKDNDGSPYIDIKYIAYFADGTNKEGVTDKEGNTELFLRDDENEIEINLFSPNFDTF